MPKSGDLAIFMVIDDREADDRQAKPITLPFAHVRGVMKTLKCLTLGSENFVVLDYNCMKDAGLESMLHHYCTCMLH